MTAAAANTDIPKKYGDRYISGPGNGGAVLYQGAMLCRDAQGNFIAAADAAGITPVVGRCAKFVDGTGLSDGDPALAAVIAEPGVFGYAASSALAAAALANLGQLVYVIDDLTVGLAADATNDIVAGVLEEFEGSTFFVRIGNRP